MNDKQQVKIEVIPCQNYVRGFMAYVWRGPFIYQVFSGPQRRDVEADARHYAGMYTKGMAIDD